MAELLNGSPVAESINKRSAEKLSELKATGVSPTLAMLRVGDREDDIAYENGAAKRCEKVGVEVKRIVLPEDVTQETLIAEISRLNADKSVHGVLMFLPLPKHLDEQSARRALSPEKDVDGITSGSLSGVFTGSGEGFPPCTAQACMEILDYYGIDCTGKRAVVIGRSLIVGKPVAMLLLSKNATVTICHTRTTDLPSVAKSAEILIASAGKAGVVRREHMGEEQILIDVGINFVDGKLCGDADFEAAEAVCKAVTPVPGGVGTVTTSVLASHVVEAAARQS